MRWNSPGGKARGRFVQREWRVGKDSVKVCYWRGVEKRLLGCVVEIALTTELGQKASSERINSR